MPIAHADPLDPIIQTVKNDRPARCPALNYDNGALEGAAQAYARSENPVDGQPAGYNGRTLAFLGSGDPQAAATTSAYSRGAGGLISNCDFTEFGVGFIRHEDREVDVVTIVFGAPAKKVEAPPEPKTTPCEGSAPVPVGTPCPVAAKPVEVPEEKKPLEPPTVAFNAIFGGVAATITDHSGVASNCTYSSSILKRNFSLPANGSTTVNIVPLAPLGIDYDVHVKCDNGTSLDTSTTF
jgi:hypothetical protein